MEIGRDGPSRVVEENLLAKRPLHANSSRCKALEGFSSRWGAASDGIGRVGRLGNLMERFLMNKSLEWRRMRRRKEIHSTLDGPNATKCRLLHFRQDAPAAGTVVDSAG